MQNTPITRTDSLEYEDLLRAIYCGAYEVPPWHRFLQLLQGQMNLSTATMVLRQPSRHDFGVLVSVGTDESLENKYRGREFVDDPFARIEPGSLYALTDVIDAKALQTTEFYRELMSSDAANIEQMLAIDIDVPAHGRAKLRFSRRRGMPTFSVAEKSLCVRLTPHLKEALGHYARNAIYEVETKVYSRALNKLSVGAIILDHRDVIVGINEVAESIVRDNPLLINDNDLLVVNDTHHLEQFEAVKLQVRRAYTDETQQEVGALRLEKPDGDTGQVLQILVHGFKLPDYHYTKDHVGLAIFISDGERRHQLSRDVIARLFGLSQAESLLVLKLCAGIAVGEAAYALGVSTNTARSQLRSVYEKTGVHRLSELIGLILHSTANLG